MDTLVDPINRCCDLFSGYIDIIHLPNDFKYLGNQKYSKIIHFMDVKTPGEKLK